MQKEGPAALAACPSCKSSLPAAAAVRCTHRSYTPGLVAPRRQPAVPTDRRRLSPDASPKKARCPSQFPPGPGPLLWPGPTPHHGRMLKPKKKDGSPDRAESFQFFFSCQTTHPQTVAVTTAHTQGRAVLAGTDERYPSIPSAAAVPLVQKATGSTPPIQSSPRGGTVPASWQITGRGDSTQHESTRVAPASLSHAQPIRTGAGHDCHYIAPAPIR